MATVLIVDDDEAIRELYRHIASDAGHQVLLAKDKRGYGRASALIKGVMLTGILYAVLVFYLVNFKY